MKLSVGNRLRLLAILPESGNIVTLKVVAKLRDKMALSEEEIKKFGVVISAQRITWDEKAEPVDIEIGPVAARIVRDSLENLDKEKKLTLPDVELWDLFMEEDKDGTDDSTIPDRV